MYKRRHREKAFYKPWTARGHRKLGEDDGPGLTVQVASTHLVIMEGKEEHRIWIPGLALHGPTLCPGISHSPLRVSVSLL